MSAPVQTALAVQGGEPKNTAAAAPRRRIPRKPEARTTDEEREARQAIESAYLSSRGEAYPWGAGDWRALRECLRHAGGDGELLLERWRFTLEQTGAWHGCNTLAQLASRWADVTAATQRGRLRQAPTSTQRRAQGQADRPNIPGFEDILWEE